MIKISITKRDNGRRGEVTRTLELQDNVPLREWVGALDGLLRQCFNEDMRRRTLNLSNDTSGQDTAGQQPSVGIVVDEAEAFGGYANPREWMLPTSDTIRVSHHPRHHISQRSNRQSLPRTGGAVPLTSSNSAYGYDSSI